MDRPIWHVAMSGKGQKRSFFHWAGTAASKDAAANKALDDMQAAWEAVAAGAGHPGELRSGPVANNLSVRPRHTVSGTDATLMHMPLWSIGSAMLYELPKGERARAPEHAEIVKALSALTRSEAARLGVGGLKGSVSIGLRLNDVLAERRNEIECGVTLSGQGVALKPGDESWLLPAVTRAASSLMAMRLGARAAKAGPFMTMDETASSATLSVAKLQRDAIGKNDAILAWYRDLGLATVAGELESLGLGGI